MCMINVGVVDVYFDLTNLEDRCPEHRNTYFDPSSSFRIDGKFSILYENVFFSFT